jgi:WD40 repeat protein
LSAPNDPTQTNTPNSVADPYATLSRDSAGDGRFSTIPGPALAVEAVPLAVGRYEIVGEIARGGMGVVYRATDRGLNREVAVKVVRAVFHNSAAAVRRFNDEATITGQLQHPGIPPVHEVGTLPDGSPFLAMKLVKGRTLDEWLKARPDPAADRGRFVAIFEQICQAVGYAHAHQVIHRDLKPANVMVGAFGEVQVMDWGLAKVLSGAAATRGGADDPDATLGTVIASARDDSEGTQAGSLLGTPAFMAPEQAMGAIDEVDARSDVFGLGAILCVILTGRPPYVGTDAEDTRKLAVRAKLDDTSHRLDGCGAEPELVALCKRCLSAEKADRPADAGELADAVADLRSAAEERAKQAELDRVKAEGEARTRRMAEEKAAEQRKRRRVQLVLAGAVPLLVLAGTAGAGLAALWQVAEREKTSAETARGEAETARDGQKAAREEAEQARDGERQARERLEVVEYGRSMQVAHQEWRENNVAATRTLLDGADPKLRGWEWHYLDRISDTSLFTLRGHTSGLSAVSWSPDGSRVVTGSEDKTAKVWDVKTGAEGLTLNGHTGEVSAVSWSPDGSRVLTGSLDKTAKVWDAKTGAEVLTLRGHTREVLAVSWSPDGSRLVTGSEDKTAKVWDAKTGAEVFTLKGHTNTVLAVLWSPDSSRLLTGSWDQTAKVWDAKTGAEVLALKGHTGEVSAVSWSPDGSRVLTGSVDNTAKVWDAKTGAEVLTLKGHTSGLSAVSWSPDESRVLTGSFDTTAKVWDAKTGAEVLTLKGHTDRVLAVSWSPDGSRVLTGSNDKTAKVWDAKTRAEGLTVQGHTDRVLAVSWSPDGSRVLTASEDKTAKVWDTKTGAEVLTLKGHTSGLSAVLWSPDESRVLTGSFDTTAKVWDAKTGAEVLTLKGHTGRVLAASWSPDGSRVLTASEDKTAKVWDTKSGTKVLTLRGHTGWVFAASWSPDGTRLLTGSLDSTAKVWDAKSGTEVLTLRGHTSFVLAASWSPDGSRVLTSSWDKTAKVWDARPLRDTRPPDPPHELGPPPRQK